VPPKLLGQLGQQRDKPRVNHPLTTRKYDDRIVGVRIPRDFDGATGRRASSAHYPLSSVSFGGRCRIGNRRLAGRTPGDATLGKTRVVGEGPVDRRRKPSKCSNYRAEVRHGVQAHGPRQDGERCQRGDRGPPVAVGERSAPAPFTVNAVYLDDGPQARRARTPPASPWADERLTPRARRDSDVPLAGPGRGASVR
jgi:hypothetical protein